MATKSEVLILTKSILETMLKEVWDPDTDPALIEGIAQDVAAQHVLALNAATPESKKLHEDSIKHSYALMGNIATNRYITSAKAGETAFTGAIQAVISLLVKATLT